jgi:hypothetical protein
MINEDLCNSGVAASRQRAALFNLLEKCGGLPTAATMKVKNEGRMMNDETYKRMEIGAPVPAAPTCLGEAVRRRKLPSEGWSGTACSIDYELRAVPEAGAPGGSATCYPQSSISHSRFSRIQAVEKPFYHGWTQMNPARPLAATTDFGLRRESRRAGATPLLEATGSTESGVAAALQSSLRFASAGCHRSPNLCRPCAKLQDCSTDQQKCIKSFEGRARHFRRRLAMAGQAVRAVVGVSAGGGQRTARPTVPDLLSVSIRVHPWFNYI